MNARSRHSSGNPVNECIITDRAESCVEKYETQNVTCPEHKTQSKNLSEAQQLLILSRKELFASMTVFGMMSSVMFLSDTTRVSYGCF